MSNGAGGKPQDAVERQAHEFMEGQRALVQAVVEQIAGGLVVRGCHPWSTVVYLLV